MTKERKVYKVGEEYRENELSKLPAPNVVTVHFDGYDKEYDNIHYPQAFVRAVMKQSPDWVSISLNGKPWGVNENHPHNK